MTEPTRKLAAIVFTDIVGFTQLTADDQQKASDLLDLQRNELKPLVEIYGGKWIKEVGDGLILTFDTITNAVQCCLKIQEKAKDIENLFLRIGIHLGEILEKENDIIGDDVNVAARIEPFSAPGGIAISNKVHDAIVRESDFTTKYLGKPKLKGVGQKVEVYCITSHGLPETILSDVSVKLEPEGFDWNVKNSLGVAASMIGFFMLINFMFLRIGFADEEETPSIAILPLDNKGAADDEFYAYGISSDLISDVASAGLIRVASLNRIEDLGDISANEMADQLDVRYIAEGTLWKRDSIFQLSMELYDTQTEKVVWSERWQKNWNEFPSIRDVLAENILEKLKVDYNTASPKIALNPDAYEFYLKAKHKYEKRENKDDAKIAQGLADKAIELDDNLIRAKVFLAYTYTDMGDNDKAIEVLGPAMEQAQRLGDKQGEAAIFSGLGTTYMNKGNLDLMIGYHEKALDIYQETGNTEKLYHNLYTIGYAHKDKGDLDKALDYLKRSLVIAENLDNKRSIKTTLYVIGNVYRNKGDIDIAQDFLKRGQALAVTGLTKEETGVFHLRDGIMCYEMCEYENAIEFLNNANKILEEVANIPKHVYSVYFTGLTYNSIGSYDTALDYFERALALNEQLDDRFGIGMCLYGIGYQHHSMGDYDKSIEYLEKSCIILKEVGVGYQWLIQPTTALFLTYKYLGREFDKEEIHTIVNNSESFEFYINIRLYKLLDNRSYLETAYSQVQKIARYLEPDIAKKFLNYPIPKQIIQEWEGVS